MVKGVGHALFHYGFPPGIAWVTDIGLHLFSEITDTTRVLPTSR